MAINNKILIFCVTCVSIVYILCNANLVWAENPVNSGDKGELEELYQEKDESMYAPAIIALDILPGAGHFYTGHYYYGIVFATLKIAGAYSIYYYWRYWDYRRSLYRSARDANRKLDPDHDLLFDDPDGGYKTVEEMKHEYDRAAHYFTLAVIGNVVVYAASALFTWMHVREINEKSIPVFDIQYSSATFNDTCEHRCSVSFTIRM